VTQSLQRADLDVGPNPFDADSVYLEKTLRHEPMELGLDDSVSLSTLAIMLVRAYVVWFIILFILEIFGGIEATQGHGGTVAVLGFVVSIIVFWLVLLRSKVTEPIGEWRALLPDRAGDAENYFNMIRTVLKRRQLPLNTSEIQERRVQLSGTNVVKHAIVISENEYQAYVTVFGYGTSLYVGWQMWRRRSGAALIKRALLDRVTAANLVTAMLRTDRARAVREAVHLACREALYAAPDSPLRVQAGHAAPLPMIELETTLLGPDAASPSLPGASTPSPSLPPSVPAAQPYVQPAAPYAPVAEPYVRPGEPRTEAQ